MQRDVFIEWDLESTPLEFRTNSVLGSADKVHVTFYNAAGQYAGRVQLDFISTPRYYIYLCTKIWTNLPVTLPSAADKVWRITKTADVRLVIHCNEVEVVNILISQETCLYSSYWYRDVSKVRFEIDTASDYYRAGD